MAILLDASQIIISNVAMSAFAARNRGVDVDGNFIKHMIINSIRMYNQKFGAEYGEMIICCDSPNNWRKDIFPYYKQKRKENKEKNEGPVDWQLVYDTMNEMVAELREFFPYKVIKIDGCEADDIIGVLASHLSNSEKTIIVSGDKDMAQLQSSNVIQYNPIKKKFEECPSPSSFLKSLIITGDDGDGIPNMLSDDDSIVNPEKRQKPIRKNKLNEWIMKDPVQFCESDKIFKQYQRNETLIDLSKTPTELQNKICSAYEEEPKGDKNALIKYFMEHRMRNLLECINQF